MIGIPALRVLAAILVAAFAASSSSLNASRGQAASDAPSAVIAPAGPIQTSPGTGVAAPIGARDAVRRARFLPTKVGIASDTQTAAVDPSDPGYGMGIAADTLANTQIGGTDNGPKTRVAYRFTVSRPTALTKIRVYFEVGRGYGGGTGGTRRVSIRTDNGGVPSGTILTSTTISGLKRFRTIRFPTVAHLEPGRFYYVVFKNIGPYPRRNFVSANALYSWSSASQPRYPGWAVLIDTNGAWRVRTRYLPVLQVTDAAGSQGIGYMEAWQTKQPAIGGAARVRERFTPSSDRSVSSVSVRLKRTSTDGTSPLTVTLAMTDGTVLAQEAIPATAFPVGRQCDCSGNRNAWGTASFPSVTLRAGTTYTLTLSSPPDTTFRAEGIREGVDYGFSPRTYFADGRMQRSSDGVTFTDVRAPYGGNKGQADLQFYFGP